MIACLPAVQIHCTRMNRFCGSIGRVTRFWKRDANRRHRRYLNRITNSFTLNPELFDEEPFAAPTLSTWDLW
jgi:hypothetical protein